MHADVRGEIARKEYSARLNKQVIRGKQDEQFMAVVQIQSGKFPF